jgi:hypothetical protein
MISKLRGQPFIGTQKDGNMRTCTMCIYGVNDIGRYSGACSFPRNGDGPHARFGIGDGDGLPDNLDGRRSGTIAPAGCSDCSLTRTRPIREPAVSYAFKNQKPKE